jgi:hypothetical protein
MPQLKLAIATLLAGTVVLVLVQSPSLDPAPLGAQRYQAGVLAPVNEHINEAPVVLSSLVLDHDGTTRARRIADSAPAP